MESDAMRGDNTSGTAAEGADAVDERATSANGGQGAPANASDLRADDGDASAMALVERLRAAAEERGREVAKLHQDAAALRDEIAQLREQPRSLIAELNDLREALEAAKGEISTRIERAAGIALDPQESAEPEPEPEQFEPEPFEPVRDPEPMSEPDPVQTVDEPEPTDAFDEPEPVEPIEMASSAFERAPEPEPDRGDDATLEGDRGAGLFRLRKRH
jgi:hypothetical protein